MTLPKLSTELVEDLAQRFPPRCLKPNETVEDHLRYAGKVELIALLVRESVQEK